MDRVSRSKQMRWIMAIGAIVLVGVLAYSSYEQTHKKFEVCVTFKGATHCSTATGATPDEAIHSAHEIDCELVTNGRDELMACMDSSPSSVREVR
jgi:hypothetical protein